MGTTITLGTIAAVIWVLWAQYGPGAGLLAIALATIVFIGTLVLAEEGNQTIDRTLREHDRQEAKDRG